MEVSARGATVNVFHYKQGYTPTFPPPRDRGRSLPRARTGGLLEKIRTVDFVRQNSSLRVQSQSTRRPQISLKSSMATKGSPLADDRDIISIAHHEPIRPTREAESIVDEDRPEPNRMLPCGQPTWIS